MVANEIKVSIHPINQIIKNAKEEYQNENFIYKSAVDIDRKYLFLKLTNKTQWLVKKYNKLQEEEFINIEGIEETHCATIEDILVRALIFKPDNPYEYLKARALIVSRDSGLIDYIEGLKIIEEIQGKNAPNYLSDVLDVFDYSIYKRIHNQFLDKFEQLSPYIRHFSVIKNNIYLNKKQNRIWVFSHMYLDYKLKINASNGKVKSFVLDYPARDCLREQLAPIANHFNYNVIDFVENGNMQWSKKEGIIACSQVADVKNRVASSVRPYLQKAENNYLTIEFGFYVDLDLYYDMAFKD